jgi:hypothetical protein
MEMEMELSHMVLRKLYSCNSMPNQSLDMSRAHVITPLANAQTNAMPQEVLIANSVKKPP